MSDLNTAARSQPTFYFIGVTTRQSSIRKIFPRWMEVLGKPEIVLEGVDLPLHADPQAYRAVVRHIKHDRLSLGGLVTTHKIDLYDAAGDLFEFFDPYARLCGEISCISKQDERLEGHAKDPISSGLSLQAFMDSGYFGHSGGHVLIFGAGGSATAILLHLLTRTDPADQPAHITLVDVRAERLAHVRKLAEQVGTPIPISYQLNTVQAVNDHALEEQLPGSLIINATGMGKDTPGSPISDRAVFPERSLVWEFNYRGELDFLHQARRQASARSLHVEDGWLYFLHGWTQVVAQALHIQLDDSLFGKLKTAAEAV